MKTLSDILYCNPQADFLVLDGSEEKYTRQGIKDSFPELLQETAEQHNDSIWMETVGGGEMLETFLLA